MPNTYLTTEALSVRIHYDVRTIRDRLKDSVLLEGVHYFRPFGGRTLKLLGVGVRTLGRSLIKRLPAANDVAAIPMANGGVCHG